LSLRNFLKNSCIHSSKLALNVPAVYDGFGVAIKECEAFQQPQNCGGEKTPQRA